MSKVEATLREVTETLAPLKRQAGSDDERKAAEWLAERLDKAGARDARVEAVPFLDGFAGHLLPLSLATLGVGIRALRRGRSTGGALLAAAAAAATVDEAENGPRLWRHLVERPKTTWNVMAEVGEGDRTLVVLAHHDAAPTGAVFDPRPQEAFAKRFPEVVAKTDTSAPIWWPVAGAPAIVALGALTGSRLTTKLGLALGTITAALGADLARDRIVPGANDNLSACAALVALAENPPKGVRTLLVSCGAEEVLQGGIYAFVERHLKQLDPATTSVLNLDTIGSPELIMLEGEGPFFMQDYADPGFRDLVAGASPEPLRRGCRARSSTDAVITSRAGYATATLASWIPETKALANYHLMSDTPENLDYTTIARAVDLARATGEALAGA